MKEAIKQFRDWSRGNGFSGQITAHIVLGSGYRQGLTEALGSEYRVVSELPFGEVAGLPSSTVVDHDGIFKLIENKKNSDARLILQVGRLHGYEGHDPRVVALPVILSFRSGVKTFVITNAAGGLDPAHEIGDVMFIEDQVNFTGKNPLYGPLWKDENVEPLGPRFSDMTRMFDPSLTAVLKSAFESEKIRTHRGVYIGVLGPNYETPAEIRAFQKWGCHSVGMSTVWETMALAHVKAQMVGMSLISNLGAGLGTGEPLNHDKIVHLCKASSVGVLRSFFRVFLK